MLNHEKKGNRLSDIADGLTHHVEVVLFGVTYKNYNNRTSDPLRTHWFYYFHAYAYFVNKGSKYRLRILLLISLGE
jgi:hypothetical protein